MCYLGTAKGYAPTSCYSYRKHLNNENQVIPEGDRRTAWLAIMQKEGEKMREGIHPTYHQATVTGNCGNTFVTGSTKPEIHVEICSKCHPFYTGNQKLAAAKGRIDKFNKKFGMQQQ